MKSKGYSLWIVPTGEANNKFTNLIKKLAKEYQAPVFQPHVTLLGDFMYSEEESIEKTKQLVLSQKPFRLNLEKIGYQDFYFRTLFVRAKKNRPLLALHNRAKEIFKKNNIPHYMPHLSILYGTFPRSLKEEIIKEIGRDQSVKFEVNSVHLVKGGAIEDWRIIGEFPLK